MLPADDDTSLALLPRMMIMTKHAITDVRVASPTPSAPPRVRRPLPQAIVAITTPKTNALKRPV